ncbi:MAG: T9SS type A sorting domain-containing protein [Bacteroidales bacterium]|nr:T9SS type A sorting domain-containing protein [Bacteroidales bacterium]
MKKILVSSGAVFAFLLVSFSLSGQCVPDPTCVDINEPGEFCPTSLPGCEVGTPYAEAITIIPPAVAIVGQAQIDIAFIVIDSVKNFPPGIGYTGYNNKYYPDTAYCIDVAGTPTAEGEYTLAIYVTPFIYFNEVPIAATQVVNDTSVVMTVTSGTGIIPYDYSAFQVIRAVPNPFTGQTKIGVYLPLDEALELKVFNILGEEIYNETMMGIHGENYFSFTGAGLLKGAYFYGITYQSGWYTGKIIKTD